MNYAINQNFKSKSKSKSAYLYIVKILSSRDYSESRLKQKCLEKNFPLDEIEIAINEIKTKGYFKPDNYTRSRVIGLMNKGYSPTYIQHKLKEENILFSEDQIWSIFFDYDFSPQLQIDYLITRKTKNLDLLNLNPKDWNKIFRYVLSKGHNFSSIKEVIKKKKLCLDNFNSESFNSEV